MTSRTVAVVGGGASGALAAIALARRTSAAVTIVEPSGAPGLGLAYGRAEPHHVLNSLAGRMSAIADAPNDFVEWAADSGEPIDPHAFAARRRYGAYLRDRLAAVAGDRVRVIEGTAVDLASSDAGVRIRVGDRGWFEADSAVLALGNPPPPDRLPASIPVGDATVIADPWAPNALAPVSARDRVLLVGSGLTAVDVATTLARRGSGVQLTMTSRHLLLPGVHLDDHPAPTNGLPGAPGTLGAVLSAWSRAVRDAAAQGVPWQAVADGVRPQVNETWARLSPGDRERFVERISRLWEVRRHRMAPFVAAELQRLRDRGVLELTSDVVGRGFDVVVDCRGGRAFATPGWNPLVDALLQSGAARPDALGIGLAIDDEGRLIGADGIADPRVFVLGPARRGTQWESTAVPEIRAAATRIADVVAGAPAESPAHTRAQPDRPDRPDQSA